MGSNEVSIDSLGLSNRSMNALHKAGIHTAGDMIRLSEGELYNTPGLGTKSISEIIEKINEVKNWDSSGVPESVQQMLSMEEEPESIRTMIHLPKYRDSILSFVKENDRTIESLGLSNRSMNCLGRQGYKLLSEIIFFTKQDLLDIPAMGKSSIEDVLNAINSYLDEYEGRIIGTCKGDDSAIYDDGFVRDRILEVYKEMPFDGVVADELQERAGIPDAVDLERIHGVVDKMVSDGEIRLELGHYFRVYGSFAAGVEECDTIDDRSKEILRKRLQGVTLNGIGVEYGLTRERVRQVVNKCVAKVVDWNLSKTGTSLFEEDWCRYLYENYEFEKKYLEKYLGIDENLCNYYETVNVKPGSKDPREAVNDTENLDYRLRAKVWNYLNRDSLYIDGKRVLRNRNALEEIAVKALCQESVSFDDYYGRYNSFLKEKGVEYDEKLYYADTFVGTVKNRLSTARFLLWKYGEQIRYYDIDSQDYTELLDELNLDAYENIEISTEKLMENHPEIMVKYDIKDEYELHNLLKKIVPEYSYHSLRFSRMPYLLFGEFSIEDGIFDLLIENSPISVADLCELVHQEFGYDKTVVQGSYLPAFSDYYHNGMYVIEQKVLPENQKTSLMQALDQDFYYIDEIRDIYLKLFPDGDSEMINSVNLKSMGFVLRSRYAIQNHSSMESLLEDLFTRDDEFDISYYKKRFVNIQMFYQKYLEFRKNLRFVEYEPNKIISMRKLESRGITKERIRSFCQAVYDFVKDGEHFTIHSIRKAGFTSDLFLEDYSEYFYSNLLISDDRFSWRQLFGTYGIYKGQNSVTISSLVESILEKHGRLYVNALIRVLREGYGCRIDMRSDLTYKVKGDRTQFDEETDEYYLIDKD